MSSQIHTQDRKSIALRRKKQLNLRTSLLYSKEYNLFKICILLYLFLGAIHKCQHFHECTKS